MTPVPPEPPTPALLRRAAEHLERLQSTVPDGQWRRRGLLASRPEVVAVDAWGNTEHVAEARARTAPWIVTMSPALAPPLVAWLRAAARDLDAPGVAATESASAAGALARALLASTSAGTDPSARPDDPSSWPDRP